METLHWREAELETVKIYTFQLIAIPTIIEFDIIVCLYS